MPILLGFDYHHVRIYNNCDSHKISSLKTPLFCASYIAFQPNPHVMFYETARYLAISKIAPKLYYLDYLHQIYM